MRTTRSTTSPLTRSRLRRCRVPVAGAVLAGSLALGSGAGASPAAAAPAAALAAPCGESLSSNPNGTTNVNYRHCTSGSDSVRVRAIIALGADGNCVTVGPNQTRTIWVYGGVSYFDRIARC